MNNDNVVALGQLNIILRAHNGHVKENITVPNIVVATGKALIASRLTGTAAAVMSHMSVGSGVVAPNTSQTALTAESGRAVLISTTAVGNVVTYTATFPAGVGTGAVNEAGIFNAASNGIMLSRTTFNVVNKDSTDSLTISWAITIN